ncbi:MAG: hypothetical protein HOL37_00145 [Rhodospirillaceae bacterium]|mgnify:FL=1|nr:hypothetical protein [Rhodospirillaceae bacterium]MBT7355246.1 hypothetical protein [Rhodospirillaceae bacterium]
MALTKSDKPGEALAAFQSAKRLLDSLGMSFEDIIIQHFDDKGMSPRDEVASLKQQKASLQRQVSEQARELKKHKAAMKDLLNQVWELRDGGASGAENNATPTPETTIQETYRPNLSA